MPKLIKDQPIATLECTILHSLGDGLREVLIVPIGDIDTIKGRMILTADDAHTIISSFKAHGTSIPIDYEHSTLHAETLPHGAPAAGWIDDLYFNPTRGLMGLVRWNSKGRDSIRSDEFRYLSPVVLLDHKTKHVRGLHSAALTTKPAIPRMERLAASANTLSTKEQFSMQDQSNTPIRKLTDELAAVLTLDSNYTNEGLLQEAINTIKDLQKKVEANGQDAQVASEVRNSLGLPNDAGVDAVKLSMSVALNDVSAKELMIFKAAESERLVEQRIQTYIDQGKLNPNHEAQMCSARNLAVSDPDTLEAIMSAAVPICPPGKIYSPMGSEGSQRQSIIIKSRSHFNHDDQLKKTTSLSAYVNMQLTKAGLTRMTDEDRQAFSITAV